MLAAPGFDTPAPPPSPALPGGPVPLHERTLHTPGMELRPGERLWRHV